jgi:uncharacterized coiled-coil protein SlyX
LCYFAAEIESLKSCVSVYQSERDDAIKEKNETVSSHQAQLAAHTVEVKQLTERINGLEQSLATHNDATDQEIVMHLEAAKDLWGKEYTKKHPSSEPSFMQLIDVINYVEEQINASSNVNE